LEKLGEGGSGTVNKAYDTIKNVFLAIKSYKKQTDLEQLILEDDLLQKVEEIRKNEPKYKEYFLKYYGTFKSPKEQDALELMMENGCATLNDILEAGKVYTCSELLYVLPKLIKAFTLLEQNGIANRDVKPQNIILVENPAKDSSKYLYKISDFGVGCKMPKGELNLNSNSLVGFSMEYAAPEVIEISRRANNLKYNPYLADVYSLGLVILKMINRKWGKRYLKEQQLTDKEAFKNYQEILEILEGMLQTDVEKRLSFKKVLDFYKSNEVNFKSKRAAPKNEVDFYQKWQLEKEKSNESTKEVLDKLFHDHLNLYLAFKSQVTRPTEARFHLDRAWEIQEKLRAVMKNGTAVENLHLLENEVFCLNYLAEWFMINGNFSEAKENLRKSLSKCKNWETEGHFFKQNQSTYENLLHEVYGKIFKRLECTSMTIFGNICLNEGNLPESKEFFLKSLDICVNSSEEADAYTSLGNINAGMGNRIEAEDFYLKSLQIRLNLFGENNAEFATSLNNLGILYHNMWHLKRANRFFRKSLNIRQKFFRENHSDVADSLENLSLLYESFGKMKIAFEFAQKAHKIILSFFGSDHPKTSKFFNQMAKLANI